MMNQDFENSMDDARTSVELFARPNAELDVTDSKLRSLFWMLREGVIGRRHFEDMLARAVKN